MTTTLAYHLITQARATCKEITVILMEENSGLSRHEVTQMEGRLQNKKNLTARLEQTLAEIKKLDPSWKTESASHTQSLYLAEELKFFQDLCRTNVAMLRAAHQIRADFIMSIRDAIDARAPRAQLYGATGAIRVTDNHTRLVAREI